MLDRLTHVGIQQRHPELADARALLGKFYFRPPAGESYVAVESPKGEKGYYMVSDGTSKPVRWRIRPPSFINLAAIPKMVEGHLLSDVIAINASIDIVMGEIDR